MSHGGKEQGIGRRAHHRTRPQVREPKQKTLQLIDFVGTDMCTQIPEQYNSLRNVRMAHRHNIQGIRIDPANDIGRMSGMESFVREQWDGHEGLDRPGLTCVESPARPRSSQAFVLSTPLGRYLQLG